MTTEVPASDYRAHLRDWHARVRAGEELIVTEHGSPSVRVSRAAQESVLDRLEREGLVRRPRPRRAASDIVRVSARAGSAAATISADRER